MLGTTMRYRSLGAGSPVVLVHAGFGGQDVWGKVASRVALHGRCVAVELSGASTRDDRDRARTASEFLDGHRRHFDGLMHELGFDTSRIVLGVSGWGSMVALDWARRHEDSVTAIAHTESIVRPLKRDDLTESGARFFDAISAVPNEPRREDLERLSTLMGIGPLPPNGVPQAPAERWDEVRSAARWASELAGWRSVPIDGSPLSSAVLASKYWEWLMTTDIPKLAIVSEPGDVFNKRLAEDIMELPNQLRVSVRSMRVPQLEASRWFGEVLDAWLTSLDLRERVT